MSGTVRDIIKKHLQFIGADGLCNSDDECGCHRDDLAPCGMDCMKCVPAIRTKATEAGDFYEVGDVIFSPLN